MRKSIVRLFFRFLLCFLVWTAATVFLVMDWTLGNLPRGPGFDTRTDEAILKYLVFLPRHGSNPIGFWFNGLVWALGLSVLYGAVRAALRMVRRWIVRERNRPSTRTESHDDSRISRTVPVLFSECNNSPACPGCGRVVDSAAYETQRRNPPSSI